MQIQYVIKKSIMYFSGHITNRLTELLPTLYADSTVDSLVM